MCFSDYSGLPDIRRDASTCLPTLFGQPLASTPFWLPIQFTENGFTVEWMDQWDMSFFEKNSKYSGKHVPEDDSLKAAPHE